MYLKTWKFSRVMYSLIILWCYMIRGNGARGTNVQPFMIAKTDSNSDLLKILLSNTNETAVNPLNPIFSMNISAGSVNFNVPLTLPSLNTNDIQSKKGMKNVRDDYTLTEGIGFHKLHTRKLNWNNARKVCMEENAHLVVINSVKEADVLSQLMKENEGVRSIYIGVHDMFLKGEWITLFGESLERAGYNLWKPGEPNNANGNEHCAILRRGEEMDDIPCTLEEYYVCEISL